MLLTFASLTEPAGRRNEDRNAILSIADGSALVLADGAGGMSGGAEAAEAVVHAITTRVMSGSGDLLAASWGDVLREIDQEVAADAVAGEATAVLACIQNDRVFGASLGDSDAVIADGDEWTVLTRRQARKPLCGSGEAVPVAFGPTPFAGTLLVASDGLFKYAPPDAIAAALRLASLDEVATALINAARLPSGGLQDDVTVILCRAT